MSGPSSLPNPADKRHNRLHVSDRAFHDWYRFVLSFPPHLVRQYLDRFQLSADSLLLDPFCGTGTTLVEAKKQNVPAVGLEAIPMAHFASRVKTDWSLDIHRVRQQAEQILQTALQHYGQPHELKALAPEAEGILLKNAISAVPLHKCLLLREVIQAELDPAIRRLFELALAYVAVHEASNLRFAPEVSVGRQLKQDANVFMEWYLRVLAMTDDLAAVALQPCPPITCQLGDARQVSAYLSPASVSAVITSPPYPNEKDYTRATRLESVLLGYLNNKADLKCLKQSLLRSNSRNVYTGDADDAWIGSQSPVAMLAATIARRREELQKTSGFSRLYQRVITLYFGGMQRHLADLRPVLRPGAQLAYVVGDQASYFQVLIRTGNLLADLAQDLGYRVVGIDLFRTRLSSVTGEHLREEVVLLEWRGS